MIVTLFLLLQFTMFSTTVSNSIFYFYRKINHINCMANKSLKHHKGMIYSMPLIFLLVLYSHPPQ